MDGVVAYEMTGMPDDECTRERIVSVSFPQYWLHVQDSTSGKYYLVRKTTVELPEGVTARMLDRDNLEDMEMLYQLLGIFEKTEAERATKKYGHLS